MSRFILHLIMSFVIAILCELAIINNNPIFWAYGIVSFCMYLHILFSERTVEKK